MKYTLELTEPGKASRIAITWNKNRAELKTLCSVLLPQGTKVTILKSEPGEYKKEG